MEGSLTIRFFLSLSIFLMYLLCHFQAIREKVKRGGPYEEVVEGCEVFVNAILLQGEIKPFLTKETIQSPKRSLRVIADVSCDPNK